MFGLSFPELLVIGLVVMLFFGNRLPQVLNDLGKGLKSFKAGMDEPAQIEVKKQVKTKSPKKK